ncbi:hypothetical protein Tsubulata_039691 [Turnera subulata]|uniref:Ubiquitin carboxyl-terminal hydrolase n=1 Tax=Turnera subulata TaxID=218843 RepID=A0A9Q0G344_9ROSI|nr:hypothetical protein Tsubulata_039691 [Turnera subulata]
MGGRGCGLQMSWQPGLLSSKRKGGGPPLGLKNLGNSCYLNSVLQCLTYTPPLANFCLRSQHSSLCDSDRDRDCPFCILEKRIVRSLRLDLPLDAPLKMQSCLRIFADHFRCGRQEDAHEFLRYVIDACHNTSLRLLKLRRNPNPNDASPSPSPAATSTVVKDIFGGSLQSQVKCLSCHCESNKVDEIMDISLDVLHSASLKDALHKFFRPEILDGNNKYKCDNCKKLVAARKQMSILEAPNVLVIQLKRFEGMFGGKIDKPIAFEEVLLLSGFMSKASQDPQPEYNLFGTIVHSGYSPESGHYYAYIKDASGRWYCCNDSYVSLSNLQDVLSEKVYILFFSRTNEKSVSNSTTLVSAGVKSSLSNGSGTSDSPKSAHLSKVMPAKPVAERSSRRDVPAISHVDKVPNSLQVKFENLGSKRVLPTAGGKIGIHNSHNAEMNGDVKESAYVDKLEKDRSNGRFRKYKNISVINGQTNHAVAVAKENGHIQNGAPVKLCLVECNGSTSGAVAGRRDDRHNFQNDCLNCNLDIPGSKRKLKEGSCILLAQDAQSESRIEELKASLKEEAYSVLQSCGWADEVYSFMYSRKRLCAGAENTLSLKELKCATGGYGQKMGRHVLAKDFLPQGYKFHHENYRYVHVPEVNRTNMLVALSCADVAI